VSNLRMRWCITSVLVLPLIINASPQLVGQSDQRAHLVQVGAHKMFVNCAGKGVAPTVILEAGTGDSSEVWNTVQEQVEKFARVCSYDRLGLGKSDKVTVSHTADEIVEDLHELLHAAPVPARYVMVGHSIGGIYVRKYAALFPTEVQGLVLLDSAHEEQFTRVSEISLEWAQRIGSRFPTYPEGLRAQGFLPRNERLAWRFDKPLIVIEHGEMPKTADSDPMAKQSEAVFHVLQKDLVSRSKYGHLREARKSGHYIQRDQPELVIQAIKDVIRESATVGNQQIALLAKCPAIAPTTRSTANMVGRLGCFPRGQNALRRVQFILAPLSIFWTTHQCVLNSPAPTPRCSGGQTPAFRFTNCDPSSARGIQ
jgi:pimeloyl-ACP methyl ester carboxylesterase